MKTGILLLLLSLSSLSFGQDNNDTLINVCIDNFFKGLNKGDTNLIKAAIYPDNFQLKSVLVNPYGNTRWEEESLKDFIKIIGTPREEIYEERILSRTIHCDGEIAVAWLPYEFYVDGNYSHEGVDLIQFAKFEGRWVMISILDTRRRKA